MACMCYAHSGHGSTTRVGPRSEQLQAQPVWTLPASTVGDGLRPAQPGPFRLYAIHIRPLRRPYPMGRMSIPRRGMMFPVASWSTSPCVRGAQWRRRRWFGQGPCFQRSVTGQRPQRQWRQEPWQADLVKPTMPMHARRSHPAKVRVAINLVLDETALLSLLSRINVEEII